MKGINDGVVEWFPSSPFTIYTKLSKIVKTGGKLESQGFSFFTVVKISTTIVSIGLSSIIE